MEALILYLLLLLGVPVGGNTTNSADTQQPTKVQKDKGKVKGSTDNTISTFDGGTGTWEDTGLVSP